MADIPTNTPIKAVAVLSMPAASTALNVFYWKLVSGGPATPNQVRQDMRIFVQGQYERVIDLVKSTITVSHIDCYAHDGSGWIPFGSIAGTWAGTSTGEMLPHGVAGLVSALTDDARVVATKYLPGFTEPAQAGGAWTSTALSRLSDFLFWWTANKENSGRSYVPGTWSTVLSEFVPFVFEGVVGAYAAYQRRRKPGVGI